MQSIFVIGDSISIQYGPWLAKFLQGRYSYRRKEGSQEALLDLDIPEGANGGDSSMVLTYIQAAGDHHEIGHPDLLLLNCGLHDIKTDPETGKMQRSPEEYRQNLQEIFRIAAGIAEKAVWVRSTPCFEEIHNERQKDFFRFRKDLVEYNRIADEVCRDFGLESIDLYGFTLSIPENHDRLFADHVHFSLEVQRLQAAFIAGWLSGTAGAVLPQSGRR